MTHVGVAAALVDGTLVPGDVVVEDGLIAEVGASPTGGHGLAVPGFVDLQVNGFAGVDFLETDPHGLARAAEAPATGVTAFQPTLISSPLEAYAPALEVIAAAARVGVAVPGGLAAHILGAHLEGPFLSPTFAGAHDPANLVAVDTAVADRLCDAGPVTYVTLAPELPGGLELVSHLVRRDIVVSLGHTDADAATAHAAYNRGARAVTHVHNAQRRWSSRDPGIAGVALSRTDVVVQAIVDGVHLAPETALSAYRAAAGRFALVTDVIEAAGRGNGTFRLGDRTVHVNGAEVRLEDGTLAGSVLTMDLAVRNLVGLGVPLTAAVAAATSVPARLIGRDELATLRPGTPADIAVLDDGLRVIRTVVHGREVHRA